MVQLTLAPPDPGLRRAVGIVSEAWSGVSAAARLLRGRGPELLLRTPGDDLRLGPLPQPPVMLVHGLGADASCFSTMARELHVAGYTVHSASYSCLGSDIESCARDLEGAAAWLLEQTGSNALHVVAHSLGGVVLRWAATHTSLGDRVAVAVTLGSPHRGTPTAHLAPSGLPGFGRIISQLRPGSHDVDDPAPAPGASTRWVTVAARDDWVVPPRYASLPEAANVRNDVVSWGGHMTLTRNPQCLAIILEELAAAGEGGVRRAGRAPARGGPGGTLPRHGPDSRVPGRRINAAPCPS